MENKNIDIKKSEQHKGVDFVYAIAFDLDTARLEELYPGNHKNQAYQDIRVVLRRAGFQNQQGTLYYGHEDIKHIDVVKAVREVQERHTWFRESLNDIRILQIMKEPDDLKEYMDL